MKNIFDSADIFEAYARIDLRYYGLQELCKSPVHDGHLSPIEQMIDMAIMGDKVREDIQTAIELIEGIIEDKKIIDADYDNDMEVLEKLREL